MKMNKLKKTIIYLKKYPFLSIIIFCFILFGSFLEIFSLGMLIPLLKSMLSSNDVFVGIPILSNFRELFETWDNVNLSTLLLIVYFILAAIRNLFFYGCDISISKHRFLLTRDLQLDFFRHLIKCNKSFFDSMKSGFLVNCLYNESNRIGDYMNGILRLAGTAVRLITYIVILTVISWKFTIVTGIGLLIISIPINMLIKHIYKIGVWINNTVADFNFNVLESLNGIRLIKISGAESYEENKFKNVADNLYNSNYVSSKYHQLIGPLMHMMFLSLFIGSAIVILRNKGSEIIAIMPFALTYVYVAVKAMYEAKAFNQFRANLAGFSGAFDSYEKVLADVKMAIMKKGSVKIDVFSKQIEFKDVYFSYDRNNNILNGITCSIPQGKKTAIVGFSGGGKTTLINLILRLYEVTKGSIAVDGIDLRELDLKSWRAKIGIVSQDIFIFNATAKENICYGNFDLPEEKMVEAAKNADIDKFITGLPEGYNTVFGERGVKLSGGQKQRLSIARAIIHDPEILIFDEATSSLDTNTERLIQRAIKKLSCERTVITIAHRLSSVISADNIIVIDKGIIVEQGTHEMLLEKKGHYAELYKIPVTKRKDKGTD